MRRSGGAEVLEGAATTRRARWFAVACCPPNLMRFLATFPDQVATVSDRGVRSTSSPTGRSTRRSAADRVGSRRRRRIRGTATSRSRWASPFRHRWTLAVRVPEWCRSARASQDGGETVAQSGPGTIELTRAWRPGDRIMLQLEMPPRATVPDPRIDAIRGTIALERGPLVYAVEDADLPAGGSVESLEVATRPKLGTVTTPEPGLGEMTQVTLKAWIRDDRPTASWPYRSVSPDAGAAPAASAETQSASNREATIRARPYFAWANRAGLGMRVWLPTRSNPKDGD